MEEGVHSPRFVRFGTFEVDLQARELRKSGLKLRLTGQPFQVLAILLERPGHVVTREELQKRLWPDGTFVDFDHSLNTAINKIREALGDSAESPRFIETLPRRGYRFINLAEAVAMGLGPERREERPVESSARAQVGDAINRRLNWRRAGAGILASMVCALALLLVYLKFWPGAESRTLTAVPFTAYPGFEMCPAFSPDGSHIVFAWNGDPESQGPRSAGYGSSGPENFDLYVKVIGSEKLVRLTHHPSKSICPAWSPDGTQIAFHRMSGADTGIYVVPALGGPERKLQSTATSNWFEVVPISWSPDGKWIAYVDSDTGSERHLFLLSVETLERRPIPHAAECLADWLPAFSHSGKELAYFCLHNPNQFVNGLYTVAVSGGNPRLLTKVSGWWGPGAPAWKAGDKKLIFANPQFRSVATASELYEVALADGSLRKLPLPQNANEPAISTKGDKLAYVTTISDGHMEIWRKDLLKPQAPGTKLIPSTYEQKDAEYSPDGKHIAFESQRSGIREVWVGDADGTNLVQISDFKDPRTDSPHWSPDSQKIVFGSRPSGQAELYIADISERMPRKVVTNIRDITFPSWSHDAKWIYFLSGGARPGVYRCPAEGGDAVLLVTLPPGDLGENPEESFDGEIVYFTKVAYNTPLEMVSLKYPGTDAVLKGMPTVLNLHAWSVARGGIYFVPADAPKSVRYFDFSTKQVRPVIDMDKYFGYGLSVSRDERAILYSQTDELNSNIMVAENFR